MCVFVVGVPNPVDELLNRHPLTVAEEFADMLLKEERDIYHHCEAMETDIERETAVAARNLSEYQQHINSVLNMDHSNITDENRNLIQNSFAQAFKNLFKEEQVKEAEISINCSRKFEQTVKEKMAAAMEYSKDLLEKSTDEFVGILDDVSSYNIQLEEALSVCLGEYTTAQREQFDNPLMVGSPSYECKQFEIQLLTQFVHEFVIRSAALLAGSNNNASHMIISALTNQIPEIFPRPFVQSLPTTDPIIELRPTQEERLSSDQPTIDTPTNIPEDIEGMLIDYMHTCTLLQLVYYL